jgi:hypothetical protein
MGIISSWILRWFHKCQLTVPLWKNFLRLSVIKSFFFYKQFPSPLNTGTVPVLSVICPTLWWVHFVTKLPVLVYRYSIDIFEISIILRISSYIYQPFSRKTLFCYGTGTFLRHSTCTRPKIQFYNEPLKKGNFFVSLIFDCVLFLKFFLKERISYAI